MASPPKKAPEVNEKLLKAMREEVEHRYEFSQKLHHLLTERNEETGGNGQQTTVEEQLRRMNMADAIVKTQLQDLCPELEDVSIREKTPTVNAAEAPEGAAAERDSGYSPSPSNSADMDNAKRKAMLLRSSQLASIMDVESMAPMGLPEIMDPPSFTSSGPTAMPPRVAGEPTEHTDNSSKDDSS